MFFDDIVPDKDKRTERQQPLKTAGFRPPQELAPPPSEAPPSKASNLSSYAVPAMAALSVLHPTSRGWLAKGAEKWPVKISEKDMTGLTKPFQAAQDMTAPTSRSDFGVNADPIVPGAPGMGQFGHTIPGGYKSATVADKLGPNKFRAETYAKEGEAILRETGGKFARLKDIYEKHLRTNWKDWFTFTPQEKAIWQQAVEAPPGSVPGVTPKMNRLLNDVRFVLKDVRTKTEEHIERKALTKSDPDKYRQERLKDFIENYFPHAWKEKLTDQHIHFFLAKRKIPTIADGIAQGLTPKYEDPIELMNHYVASATRYLAKNEAFTIMENQGLVRYHQKSNPAAEGWKPVEGPIGKRAFDQAHMPAPLARIFNQMFSKGFEDAEHTLVYSANQVFNKIKAGALMGSGYHAVTTFIQSMVNDVQRGVKLAAAGKPLKALATAATSPGALGKALVRGRRLEKQWLNISPGAAELARPFDYRVNPQMSSFGTRDEQIGRLLQEAGGRAKPYSQASDYRFSDEGRYFQAWKKGSMRMEAIASAKDFKESWGRTAPRTLWKTLTRSVDTIASPVFEYLVPTAKNGAFYGRMGDWLETHPFATQKEAVTAAREIVDSMDNIFGEMIHDNIYWKKTWKQVAQLATVSYSYELGTLRQVGGGISDALKGVGSVGLGDIKGAKKFFDTERAAYILALPIGYAYINSIYHALKTGQPPQSILDLVAPQTGGIDARTSKPERLYPPGDLKDVIHLYEDPYALISGKLAPGPSAIWQVITNADWKGSPVHKPNPSFYDAIQAFFMHIGNAMTPISLQTQYGPKTGLNMAERAMGMRPAGLNLTDPKKSEELKRIREKKAWNKKLHYDKRQESFYGEHKKTGGVE